MRDDEDIEILDADDNTSPSINKNLNSTSSSSNKKNSEKINNAVNKNRVNQASSGGPINNGNQFKNSGNLSKISKAANANTPEGQAENLKNMGKDAIKPIVRKGVQAATGGVVGSDPVTKKIIDNAVDKAADNPQVDKIVGDVTKKINKQKRKLLLKLLMPVISFLFMFLVLVMAIMVPVALASEVAGGIGNWFSSVGNFLSGNGFCANETECQSKYSEKYFSAMDDFGEEYNSVCNIEWNSELISGTIFYEQMMVMDNIDIPDDSEDDENLSESVGSFYNYKNADKKVKVLTKKLYPKFENSDLSSAERCRADYTGYSRYLPSYINSNFKELKKPDYSEYTNDVIVEEIMAFGNYFYGSDSNGVCSSSCEYNIDGKSVSNLMVQLLDNSGNAIDGQDLIPFEKYILGVVYGEMGASPQTEAAKTQAIAARSFALTRANVMNGAGGVKLVQENNQWILYIRNSTNDQVYCDPDVGCSQRSDAVFVSGFDNVSQDPNASYKPKNGLDGNSPLRSAVAEVAGVVALNADGQIIITGYTSTQQNEWSSLAQTGQDYTEILRQTYSEIVTLTTDNCSSLCNSASGSYTEWKQYNWPNIYMNNYTIKEAGCLTVAISMQVARSGVETALGSEFNPGTLVENYRDVLYNGNDDFYWYSITQIAPDFVRNPSYDYNNMASLSDSEQAAFLMNGINNGCYYVLEVKSWKSGQHWVALDTIQGNTIYMLDPASTDTVLNEHISGNGYPYRVNSAKCYVVRN